MRRRKAGHDVAVRRRPGTVVVHPVRKAERPVVEHGSSGIHVEVRGGGLVKHPHDCVIVAQLAGVGDAAHLQPHAVPHSGPEYAPFAVETSNEPHLAVDVEHQPSGLHRAAGGAGASGQGGNHNAVGESEQNPPGCRSVGHDPSPVEVKGIMISQKTTEKSTQRI